LFKEVIQGFREQDQRCKYHTLEHTCNVLNNIQVLLSTPTYKGKLNERDIALVQLAAVFHDYKYDPSGTNREETSASEACDFFEEILYGWEYESSFYERIEELILATKHQEMQKEIVSALLCDADILGMAAEDYNSFRIDSGLIKEEILGSQLAEITEENTAERLELLMRYAIGRAGFLQENFLKRKKIFHLVNENNKFEINARRNLESEVKFMMDEASRLEEKLRNYLKSNKESESKRIKDFEDDELVDRILLGDYFWNEGSESDMPDIVEIERWNHEKGIVETVRYYKKGCGCK
jgi:predicted metal-dependent HD superfamily phosphohydrolase